MSHGIAGRPGQVLQSFSKGASHDRDVSAHRVETLRDGRRHPKALGGSYIAEKWPLETLRGVRRAVELAPHREELLDALRRANADLVLPQIPSDRGRLEVEKPAHHIEGERAKTNPSF